MQLLFYREGGDKQGALWSTTKCWYCDISLEDYDVHLWEWGEVGAKDEQTNKRLLKDSCMLNSTGIYQITWNLPTITLKKTDSTWILKKGTAGQ